MADELLRRSVRWMSEFQGRKQLCMFKTVKASGVGGPENEVLGDLTTPSGPRPLHACLELMII